MVVRNELGENVAKGKPASASSTMNGTSPATAVDGFIGARAHPSEFVANTPYNAWWMVDLQNSENIVQVRYYNRADCCQNRIVGAKVQLLDENKQLLSEYTITHDGPETIIHTYQKTPTVPVPTANVSVASPISIVWGVNSNDDIYTREGVNGSWRQIEGKLKNISVGQDGRVWGVNSNDDIYTREGVNGSWRQIDGKLKNISVGQDGRVWGVNSIDDIYTREGVNGSWRQIDGKLKQIHVTKSGTVWGVNSKDSIYTREGANGSWRQIEGALKWVCAQ
jgi:uncharacterized protein YjbJ (UPF0337 family)